VEVLNFNRVVGLAVAAVVGATAAGADAKGTAPDLNGIYYSAHPPQRLQPIGGTIPLTEAGRKASAANAPLAAATKAQPAGVHMEACTPAGPTRILEQPYPLQVVQKGGTIVLIWEHNHVFERVYLDQQPPADVDDSYMGFSVGHWEGSTLVVDSSHFNAKTFLDDNGLPHTADMKVQRRLRKVQNGKALEITVRVTDPAMYSRPWTVRTVFPARPDIDMEEYVCGENTLETRYTSADQ
jgi:hypothetical protein